MRTGGSGPGGASRRPCRRSSDSRRATHGTRPALLSPCAGAGRSAGRPGLGTLRDPARDRCHLGVHLEQPAGRAVLATTRRCRQLSVRVPLTDRAVIETLTHAPDLNAAEQQAVQDLYFAPRAMLAGFALLFADFATAQQRLIEEPDEDGPLRVLPAPVPAVPPAVRGHRGAPVAARGRGDRPARGGWPRSGGADRRGLWRRTRTRRSAAGRATRALCPR